jgi:hypothetical protein
MAEQQSDPPPPPDEVNRDEEYHMSVVEESTVYGNQLQYLIRWTGCYSLTSEPVIFVDGIRQSRSSLNNITKSLDHWTIFSENLKPTRGILSQFEHLQRPLQIVM